MYTCQISLSISKSSILDHIFYLSCQFNYHHKFCIDEDLERQCADAELGGAAVVHGSAKTFHNNYAPAFRAIYDAMQKVSCY